MTPKEKAKELVSEMYSAMEEYAIDKLSKRCALIAVDEIIKSQKCCDECAEEGSIEISYWQQVKNETEKL